MITVYADSDPFLVNPPSSKDQAGGVVALPSGGLLGVWRDETLKGHDFVMNGIGLRFISGIDPSQGIDVLLPPPVSGIDSLVEVDPLSGGRIVLSFLSGYSPTGRTGVFEIINPDGTVFVSETNVGRNTSSFTVEDMSSGGFVAAYTSYNPNKPTLSDDVWAVFFGADGQATSGAVRLNATTVGRQADAVCTEFSDSRVLAVWTDSSQAMSDPNGTKLIGRFFQADGTPGSHEFLISTTVSGTPSDGRIAELGAGKFVAVWRIDDTSMGGSGQTAIFGQLFHANGTAVGAAFQIDVSQSGGGFYDNLSQPQIKSLPDGRFVVTWHFYAYDPNLNVTTENRLQVFDANGTAASVIFAIGDPNADVNNTSVDVLADGRIVVSWEQPQGLQGRPDLYTQILDSRDQGIILDGNDLANEYVGSNYADAMRGGAGDDSIVGAVGNDTISGDVGNDFLAGDDGHDRLSGNQGNDTMFGLAGADTLNGGNGDDLLIGGSGADLFMFKPGDGIDTIRKFQDGADRIDLIQYHFVNFSDAASHFTATTGGVVFTSGTDAITILGLSLANLTANDLLLA